MCFVFLNRAVFVWAFLSWGLWRKRTLISRASVRWHRPTSSQTGSRPRASPPTKVPLRRLGAKVLARVRSFRQREPLRIFAALPRSSNLGRSSEQLFLSQNVPRYFVSVFLHVTATNTDGWRSRFYGKDAVFFQFPFCFRKNHYRDASRSPHEMSLPVRITNCVFLMHLYFDRWYRHRHISGVRGHVCDCGAGGADRLLDTGLLKKYPSVPVPSVTGSETTVVLFCLFLILPERRNVFL